VTPPRHPFDALAAHYWWLETVTFGPLLQRCRTAHLPRLAGCRRALVVGDGDGRFLAELLRANPAVAADSLDISPGMLAAARRRVRGLPGAGRARFVVGDVRTVALPAAAYDLVVTNFVLDCFPADQLAGVVTRLAAAAAPDSLWLEGDFAVPAGRWRGQAARLALAGMYAAFRSAARISAAELVDVGPLIAVHGFAPAAEMTWLGGFLRSRLWTRSTQRMSPVSMGRLPLGTASGGGGRRG